MKSIKKLGRLALSCTLPLGEGQYMHLLMLINRENKEGSQTKFTMLFFKDFRSKESLFLSGFKAPAKVGAFLLNKVVIQSFVA
jgi:hypothetical protein